VQDYEIFELPCLNGVICLTAYPGVSGDLGKDLQHLRDWQPDCVVTFLDVDESAVLNVPELPETLNAHPFVWMHIPTADYGVPSCDLQAKWDQTQAMLIDLLQGGGNVMFHCRGGCGRSGMGALRVMIAAGEAADAALTRLRKVRPCAVETQAQLDWAQNL